MTGTLLLRGMIIGVIAGALAFIFAYIFGEPQVDLAIAFEEQAASAASAGAGAAAEEPPLVSRETQAGIGLLTGLVGYGAAIGGMFALVFAFGYGRLGRLNARASALLLAMAAFVATALVPLLKYPANPPAVGFDDTIGPRTQLYFLVLAVSIASIVALFMVARWMWDRRGAWTATMVAGAVYLALIAGAFALLPSINEMPKGFDPLVIWNFRVASLGIHLILWTSIGLMFGAMAERLIEGQRSGLRA